MSCNRIRSPLPVKRGGAASAIWRRSAWALMLAAVTPGCMLPASESDADGLEVAVGEAGDDVVVLNNWWWGSPGGFEDLIDLGSASNRTCFLTAVNGHLAKGRAVVRIVEDRWRLDLHAPVLHNIGVGVACISATANRVFGSWKAGENSNPFAAALPNRRCFLSGIGGGTDSWINDPTWDEWVSIDKLNNDFRIDGNAKSTSGVFGNAVCVDTTFGFATASLSGSSFMHLKSDGPGGWVCGLTAVGGVFNGQNWDGVELVYDSSALYWDFQSDAGKRAKATCAK
jgi:hypothetical protein